MAERILCVDDESNILAAHQRNLRKHFSIEVALGPQEGLSVLERDGPFAVVISDMRMPLMDGVEFLSRVKRRWPDTVRMILTGNADVSNAIQSVNEGNIFRFLTKPCEPEHLIIALKAGIAQYQLIKAERDLLQHTLNGSIKTLTEILSVVAPESFGNALKLRSLVKIYAANCNLTNIWELELAATLSDIGFVSLPPAVALKTRIGQALTATEQTMLDRVPEIGRNLLANIPRMESIARTILYHRKQYDGSGFPADNLKGVQIPEGSRILKVLSDFLRLESSGIQREEAMKRLRNREGWYDPAILDKVQLCFANQAMPADGTAMSVKQLRVGQVLVSDVKLASGQLLIVAGQDITEPMLERIWNFSKLTGIQEPIFVR